MDLHSVGPHTSVLRWEYWRSRYHLYVVSSFSPSMMVIFCVARCRTERAVVANNATFFFCHAIPCSIQSHMWHHAVRNISQINTYLNPGTVWNSWVCRTYSYCRQAAVCTVVKREQPYIRSTYSPYVWLVRTGLYAEVCKLDFVCFCRASSMTAGSYHLQNVGDVRTTCNYTFHVCYHCYYYYYHYYY